MIKERTCRSGEASPRGMVRDTSAGWSSLDRIDWFLWSLAESASTCTAQVGARVRGRGSRTWFRGMMGDDKVECLGCRHQLGGRVVELVVELAPVAAEAWIEADTADRGAPGSLIPLLC